MTRLLAVLLFAVSFGTALISGAARADETAIQGVISSQIEAFQADDFDRAFTFASPMIKGMFRTPENFGRMVMNGYPMVWRPAGMRFGGLVSEGGKLIQTVFFTDQAGRLFEAAYEMIETEAGWQINGVYIREADIGA